MQESTGKEVVKNIEIESGPALGNEAKQQLNNDTN